jgi:hypothetical protein
MRTTIAISISLSGGGFEPRNEPLQVGLGTDHGADGFPT